MIPIETETIPCEVCGKPTSNIHTKRCDNCWEVEWRLPAYIKSPDGWDFVRKLIPKLDDWVDGHPDAWDYNKVLSDNAVTVEWCDTVIDGEGTVHRAGEYAGWSMCWKHGVIFVGRVSETIARKAAALFVSLWLRGVSASFADKVDITIQSSGQVQTSPEMCDQPKKRVTCCKDCKFYDPEARHRCACPKMIYGYGLTTSDNILDTVDIEDDEGWGMIPGPEFGCIHAVPEGNA